MKPKYILSSLLAFSLLLSGCNNRADTSVPSQGSAAGSTAPAENAQYATIYGCQTDDSGHVLIDLMPGDIKIVTTEEVEYPQFTELGQRASYTVSDNCTGLFPDIEAYKDGNVASTAHVGADDLPTYINFFSSDGASSFYAQFRFDKENKIENIEYFYVP